MSLLLTALHIGALHPYERLIIGLVAVGPFFVLFVVVYVVRRRDLAKEQRRTPPEEHLDTR